MKKKKTVFIINNNKEEVEELRQAVAHVNRRAKCFSYSNSITALRRLYQVSAKPSLIIIDLGMPLVSGKDWLELLKSEPSLFAIPVIVCGNDGYDRRNNASIARHAYGYFTKPFLLQTIEETLTQVLRPEAISNVRTKNIVQYESAQVS